eukprot:357472_1
MTEQLESALLTTDNYDTNNENNIQEFNSCTIYLDGKASIVTLGVELQKAAKAEKVALKWKAISVIILTFSLLGDIFAILLIEVLSEKTFGIILCVLSVMSTIVSSALCFISFKTKTSKHYFISQWRNGLKFDKTNKCIKEIQFQPDYGLNPNVSFDMKFINVHEPIIEEKEINIICAFDDVTDIGQTINPHPLFFRMSDHESIELPLIIMEMMEMMEMMEIMEMMMRNKEKIKINNLYNLFY